MSSPNPSVSNPSLFNVFTAITKARLTISVMFSTLAGYALGVDQWNAAAFKVLLLLSVGGYCMVGASNVFNQIIEKDLDALMDRTKNRPLPAGLISKRNAFILGCILTILGLAILYSVNEKTALFGAISIFLAISSFLGNRLVLV